MDAFENYVMERVEELVKDDAEYKGRISKMLELEKSFVESLNPLQKEAYFKIESEQAYIRSYTETERYKNGWNDCKNKC